MLREAVYCADCEFWHPDNASKPSRLHMCAAWPNPNARGYGFVTRDKWDRDDPFRRCADLNRDGICPLYREKRGPQMEMINE